MKLWKVCSYKKWKILNYLFSSKNLNEDFILEAMKAIADTTNSAATFTIQAFNFEKKKFTFLKRLVEVGKFAVEIQFYKFDRNANISY